MELLGFLCTTIGFLKISLSPSPFPLPPPPSSSSPSPSFPLPLSHSYSAGITCVLQFNVLMKAYQEKWQTGEYNTKRVSVLVNNCTPKIWRVFFWYSYNFV